MQIPQKNAYGKRVIITCRCTDRDGRGGNSGFRGFSVKPVFHIKAVGREKRNEHKFS